MGHIVTKKSIVVFDQSGSYMEDIATLHKHHILFMGRLLVRPFKHTIELLMVAARLVYERYSVTVTSIDNN